MNSTIKDLVQNADPIRNDFKAIATAWFSRNSAQIDAVAPSKGYANELRAGLYDIVRKNPTLMEATTESLGNALLQTAQLGLYLGPLQEAHILVFKNSKKVNGNWVKVPEATFCLGYQGLIKLMMQSEMVADIQVEAVYPGDVFRFELGTKKVLQHVPAFTGDHEPDNFDLVYCVITLKSGAQIIRVRDKKWVERRRLKSPAGTYDKSPWDAKWNPDNYLEMALKSILKYTGKYVPKSAKIAKAMEFDVSDDAVQEPSQPETEIKPVAPKQPQQVEQQQPEPQPVKPKTKGKKKVVDISKIVELEGEELAAEVAKLKPEDAMKIADYYTGIGDDVKLQVVVANLKEREQAENSE